MARAIGYSRGERKRLYKLSDHFRQDLRYWNPAMFTQAIDVLQTELAHNPHDVFINCVLASVYIQNKEFQKALSILNRLYLSSPNNPRVVYHLATVYHMLTFARMADSVDTERYRQWKLQVARLSGPGATFPIDPIVAKSELTALKLTISEVAQRSVILFTRVMDMNIERAYKKDSGVGLVALKNSPIVFDLPPIPKTYGRTRWGLLAIFFFVGVATAYILGYLILLSLG